MLFSGKNYTTAWQKFYSATCTGSDARDKSHFCFPSAHLLKPTLWSWVARAGFPETQHTPRLSPQLAMITYFSAKIEPCKWLLEMKKKYVNESYNHMYVIISYLYAVLYLFNLKWGHPLLWSPTCLLQRQPDQIVAEKKFKLFNISRFSFKRI